VGADPAVGTVDGNTGPQGCFAYFYLMKADPDRVRLVAPRHAAYWRQLGLARYTGGPFADRTGGLITFDAGDAAAAERAVRGDPFILAGLIDVKWLKRWTPEPDRSTA